MSIISEIDALDKQILSILMEEAKMPYTEIAKILNISGGTVHVRMKKLEVLGIVKGANLTIDYNKLGYDVTAYLGIHLEKSSLYDDVVVQLKQIPEMVEAHYTTGAYSIFAKVVCKDTKHLRMVLHDGIQKINGIERTETFISLEETVRRPLNFTLIKDQP
jgi:Lrp/AsnC family transcriptional regulator, regulator for asnA, asnC and gidA